MNVEFVDTNVLVYAHDRSSGAKHDAAIALLGRLTEQGNIATSIQVLTEFYSVATKKMGMSSEEAESHLADFGWWLIHRPAHQDLLRAARLQRKHKLSWWDALMLTSVESLGSVVVWTEDLSHGHRYGTVQALNPFKGKRT